MHNSGFAISSQNLLLEVPRVSSSNLRFGVPPHQADGGLGEDGPGVAGAGLPLPCLNSNNCTDKGAAINQLTGGHQRTAFALIVNIQALCERYGLERMAFLTLTFRDHVLDMEEAQRRFHSLATHVLSVRYKSGIGVWERQESGRLHCHLVVPLESDVRSGFDFAACKRKDYRSANKALRAEWAFWRRTAPAYGFGRTEVLPIRSSAEGIAKYVGKYVAKHVGKRWDRDKGARVVRYLGFGCGLRRASTRFAWAGLHRGKGWLWRQKLKAYCQRVGIKDTEELSRLLGHRWAYALQHTIMAEPIPSEVVYPSWDILCLGRAAEDPALVSRFRVYQWREAENQAGSFSRSFLLGGPRVMSSDPVWAVPWWDNSEFVVPSGSGGVVDIEERCRAMQLYAMRVRLTPWHPQGLAYCPV